MTTADAQADAAARLIEYLLADADLRARFRRDPVATCHQAGLHELAAEMQEAAGKGMFTMDPRESKSSLAGVMMAAAVEGLAAWSFVEHVAPAIAEAPAAVVDVLSRVNLPALGHAAPAAAATPALGAVPAAPPIDPAAP